MPINPPSAPERKARLKTVGAIRLLPKFLYSGDKILIISLQLLIELSLPANKIKLSSVPI